MNQPISRSSAFPATTGFIGNLSVGESFPTTFFVPVQKFLSRQNIGKLCYLIIKQDTYSSIGMKHNDVSRISYNWFTWHFNPSYSNLFISSISFSLLNFFCFFACQNMVKLMLWYEVRKIVAKPGRDFWVNVSILCDSLFTKYTLRNKNIYILFLFNLFI